MMPLNEEPLDATEPGQPRQDSTDSQEKDIVVRAQPQLAAVGVERSRSSWPEVAGYEILAELGKGGMGVVYKAHHRQLDRTVALKMIRSGAGADEAELARFRTEARAVAKLQHPHVVQIYEVGEHEGLPFFSLEFCSGGSLAARLKESLLPPRVAALLVEQIARGMHAAHRHGIIHRDLKPDNVLLTEEGIPRVADFGLAKKLDEAGQTATEAVMGTPSYMAPEQASGQSSQAGPLADVYALGAILYECLTGRPPFKAASAWETIKQVLTVDPVPPRQLNASVPRELETICLKGLEKNPARRYASAEALAEDLCRWQAGEPVRARSVGQLEKTVKWVRRKPTAAALVAVSVLALLVVLVGGGLFTLFLARERDRAVKAEEKAKERLRNEQIQSARSTLERAQLLCEQGEINRGLLWLSRGLETARLAQAEELEQAFRWNLGAWLREVHRLERILPHPDTVEAVALNREGTLLATGCADGKVRLWDMATGRMQGEPLNHPGPVHALAFQPQGELLLTGCADGLARLWHVPTRRITGQPLVHYRVPGPATEWPWQTGILSVAFSPDGRSLATAGRDATVRLWETATGRAVGTPLTPGGIVFGVAFRPDGQAFLTAGQNGSVQQWNPATGQSFGPRMRQAIVFAAAYSPNGKSIVAGYLQTRAAQWDPLTGQAREPLLRHREAVYSVCYSPDGQLVLTGSVDQTARLWDSATGRPVGSPLEHFGEVLATAFSPDGKTVITGSSDRLVRLWKIAPGSPRHTLPHPSWVRSVAFSPDGTRLLTGAVDGAGRLWDTSDGKLAGPLLRQGGWVMGVAFCPDGKTAFGLGGPQQNETHLVHWDLQSGQRLREGSGHADGPWRLAYHPGSSTLVTGGAIVPAARIWDATTLRPRGDLLRHGNGTVMGVAVSPDGRLVLTGGEDKTTRLWDSATGQPLGPPIQHSSGISAVAFNYDGQRILTGHSDRTVQQWQAATWKPLGAPLQHQGVVHGVAFVGRGPLLASCGDDNTARFWFAPTSHAVGPPLVHQDRVSAIAVSPDGTTLATASDDNTAKLWTVPLPVTEEPDQVAGWVQALTGRELDEHGTIRALPSADWQSRRDRFPFASREDQP